MAIKAEKTTGLISFSASIIIPIDRPIGIPTTPACVFVEHPEDAFHLHQPAFLERIQTVAMATLEATAQHGKTIVPTTKVVLREVTTHPLLIIGGHRVILGYVG